MNPLCDPLTFEETDEGFSGINPPIWGTSAFNHYREGLFKFYKSVILLNVQALWLNGTRGFHMIQLEVKLYFMSILSIFLGTQAFQTMSALGLRTVSGNMQGIIRYFWNTFAELSSANVHTYICSLQQRQSAVFISNLDDTYDAYEKDIAMVSIFFKKDTVYEFKR